ncbi:hypothetical protein EB796_025212 [Bugula neritina]|uniref:Uncharacterized protein n=1 Tax=Bugula neritina TaxID=10212 RepID=A0A7J7ITD7_BUGNE|nr:hypothetical protein EB796_025212 [Bugula neritina]
MTGNASDAARQTTWLMTRHVQQETRNAEYVTNWDILLKASSAKAEDEDAALYNIKPSSNITIPKCNASIEGVTVEFILDAGACDNVVSAATYHRIARNVELLPTDKQLYGYGTESKRILRDSGEIRQTVDMQCANKAVVYKEGNSDIADPLSRLCSESNCPVPVNSVMRITEAHADCVAKSAVPIAMTWEEIREASLDCLEIKHVIESLRADSMKKCSTAYQAVKLNKARAKHYANAKAKAIESEIFVGDKVLLRQNKTCKLDANFGEKPYIVIGKEGSELVCEDREYNDFCEALTIARQRSGWRHSGDRG